MMLATQAHPLLPPLPATSCPFEFVASELALAGTPDPLTWFALTVPGLVAEGVIVAPLPTVMVAVVFVPDVSALNAEDPGDPVAPVAP
jgi:hypothetical protein